MMIDSKSTIDEFEDLYRKGIPNRNPSTYQRINCELCKRTIGWNAAITTTITVAYCEKCYRPIYNRLKREKEED
jgi:hypothetical protein